MVLAITVMYNLECRQVDYNNAVLNTEVEEVYAKLALGYKEYGVNGVLMVVRLRKILYGHRQSPNFWWGTVDTHVAEIGFKSLKCLGSPTGGSGDLAYPLYDQDNWFPFCKVN